MAFFGKNQKKVDIYQDALQNAFRNPFTAARNVFGRANAALGTGAGFGTAVRSAFTPQTALAADNTFGGYTSPGNFDNGLVRGAVAPPITQPQTEGRLPTVSNRTDYRPGASSQPSQPAVQNFLSEQVQSPEVQSPQIPTAPPPPQSLGFFLGKEYFDPAELYDDQLKYLDSVYGSNLSSLRTGKTKQLDAYGKQKTDLAKQLEDVLSGYGQQEKTSLGNIANYYSGLGDIYQSSQGTREGELRGEVEKARGKSRTQATEGQTSIEKAIADYLEGYGKSEQELASQYVSAKDQLGSGVVSDLGNRLGVQQQVGAGVDVGLTPEEINANNALIARLQGIQSKFRNPFAIQQGNQLDYSPILQYLQGLV